MKPTLKSWATPLAIGAFIISGVTGVLIFFDIETGLVEPVHKWLSWLLVGGVLAHVLANLKAFTHYFSKNTALAIIGASMLVTAVAVMPFIGENDGEHREKRAARASMRALESSSLETLALVMKKTPDELEAELALKGMKDFTTTMSIGEIAAGNGVEPETLLAGMFSSGHEKSEHHDKD
ncbi:DUF4405 domain-containing protein [Chlorobium sp. N1]|uniref:DUF4405 domain-containing protein n=1 Tax=Chlorobium sp. N1 TaxID=2491138 RepID=UPI00103C2B70|nr:DUF4405 domain-containing protein [Chlorobium sp. N1]TCD47151.1 DUF4405 domain-containing protein [Chlorobium sp. N1]